MHGAKSVIGEKYLQLVKGNRKDSLKIINLAIFYLYSFNSRTWKSRNGECGTTLIDLDFILHWNTESNFKPITNAY